jgi:hypothetical protein
MYAEYIWTRLVASTTTWLPLATFLILLYCVLFLEKMSGSLSSAQVTAVIQETGLRRYESLREYFVSNLLDDSRDLTSKERDLVLRLLRAKFVSDAEQVRSVEDISNRARGILIITAYTDNYSIGRLCEHVNREYALKHGYDFINHELPYADMLQAVGPKKTHCTWYKVLMLNKILSDEIFLLQHRIQYIVWIDADALVVNSNMRMEEIISKGCGRDLIIAEDMNAGESCLLNAGVMLVRVSDWSRQLWQDVWACPKKFDTKRFYEQSALLRSLKSRGEGVERGAGLGGPFHTFLPGATQGVKLFAHVAVLPHLDLNSNSGWLASGAHGRCKMARQQERQRERERERERESHESDMVCGGTGLDDGRGIEEIEKIGVGGKGGGEEGGGEIRGVVRNVKGVRDVPLLAGEMARFIFHAAGRVGKARALLGVLRAHRIEYPPYFDDLEYTATSMVAPVPLPVQQQLSALGGVDFNDGDTLLTSVESQEAISPAAEAVRAISIRCGEVSKGGAGGANWGSDKLEALGAEKHVAGDAEVAKETVEVIEVEVAEPVAPEPTVFTFDEYTKRRSEVAKTNTDAFDEVKLREVTADFGGLKAASKEQQQSSSCSVPSNSFV